MKVKIHSASLLIKLTQHVIEAFHSEMVGLVCLDVEKTYLGLFHKLNSIGMNNSKKSWIN